MFRQGKTDKEGTEAVFDLEKDLQSTKTRRDVIERIELRIQKIKALLRSGQSKEDFDRFGVLLHGYASLMKVVARFGAKP